MKSCFFCPGASKSDLLLRHKHAQRLEGQLYFRLNVTIKPPLPEATALDLKGKTDLLV